MTLNLVGIATANHIQILGSEINSFVTNILLYNSVTIRGYINCGSTKFEESYTTSVLGNTTNKFYITLSGTIKELVIKPALFSLTTFQDSVITLQIVFNKTDSFDTYSKCAFLDVTLKCKVAATLASLIDEVKNPLVEQKSNNIHLLHYALVNSNNCGCDCKEICNLFEELNSLIKTVKITGNCGC